jgi:basic amino acid/polyamine antiporter, APA family
VLKINTGGQFLWYKLAVPESSQAVLVRAIGRGSLAALVINSIIGSGIFGLPSDLARLLGRVSPLAVLIAGIAIGIIMACFAEVGSQFSKAGGPYLYARVTFGRLIGIEVGWLLWLVRVAAPAANANLFVIYLGEFWAAASEPVPRLLTLTLLIAIHALINFCGVRSGTRSNDIFTVAKLMPLFLIAIAGTAYIATAHQVAPEAHLAAASSASWLKAILLLVFAYGGFESAVTPMSEAKNPRGDIAFALLVALVTCATLYTAIQWVVVTMLADPAHSQRPLADVARLIAGAGGARLMSIGALVSTYANISANMLAVPRITFALAEHGDFPSIFAAVHPKFRTPYISILAFGIITWLLALLGSFSWNLTLSAVARLFYYGVVCAALLGLRRKQPEAALFRLPAAHFFAFLGIAICLLLITQVDLSKSLILLSVILVALMNWLAVRKRKA